MNKSFTFLHGTNLLESKSNYIQLFNQLLDIATTYRYALPTTIAHQDKNNYFSGWNYEILKPNNSYINSFYLVVIEPDCPGISPINPFHKIDNHPMFAVNICSDHFITWQEGDSNFNVTDKFIECATFYEIQNAFRKFLAVLGSP